MTLEEWRARYVGQLIRIDNGRGHGTTPQDIGIVVRIEEPCGGSSMWANFMRVHFLPQRLVQPRMYYIHPDNAANDWHIHIYGEPATH